MSGWDAWNAHVMAVKDISAGGIFTFEGAVCHQQNMNVSPQEIKAIVAGMTGNTVSSLMIGGVKYMLLRSDPDSLQARVCCFVAVGARRCRHLVLAVSFPFD